jgi:hypothetical protein
MRVQVELVFSDQSREVLSAQTPDQAEAPRLLESGHDNYRLLISTAPSTPVLVKSASFPQFV